MPGQTGTEFKLLTRALPQERYCRATSRYALTVLYRHAISSPLEHDHVTGARIRRAGLTFCGLPPGPWAFRGRCLLLSGADGQIQAVPLNGRPDQNLGGNLRYAAHWTQVNPRHAAFATPT